MLSHPTRPFWLAGLAAVAPLAPAAEAKNPADVAPRTISILHTNDIHGHLESWKGWEDELKNKTVGGLDRIAARIHEQRATMAPDSSLLLDAGDTIGDSMIAAETKAVRSST